jgi:hypothetical protein
VKNPLLVAGGNKAPNPEAERWGRWVENAYLARVINDGIDVHLWREEPLEVDAVVSGAGGERYLLEVKTRRYSAEDLRGLAHTARKFPESRPLVLCDPGWEHIAVRDGVEAGSWVEYLI